MKKQILTIAAGILLAAGIIVPIYFFVKIVIQDHRDLKAVVEFLQQEIAKANPPAPLPTNSAGN